MWLGVLLAADGLGAALAGTGDGDSDGDGLVAVTIGAPTACGRAVQLETVMTSARPSITAAIRRVRVGVRATNMSDGSVAGRISPRRAGP